MTDHILPNQIFVLKNGEYELLRTNNNHYMPNEPMWACGVCRQVHVGFVSAKECCEQKFCECGAKIAYKGSLCPVCHFRKDLNSCTMVEYHGGPVNVFNSERYFESMEALLEHYDGQSDDKWPEWCHPCEIGGWDGIDIESVIESEMDELSCDDVREQLTDEDELINFVKDWNKKQSVILWYPDTTKKIKIVKPIGTNERNKI